MNRDEFFALFAADKSSDELKQLRMAYWLAKEGHRPQTRDDGERYFEHVRGVANLLIVRGFKDTSVIIKALLHDLIEDTSTPHEIIVDQFGADMWMSLSTLSKSVPIFHPITGKVVRYWKKTPEEYFGAFTNAPFEDRLVKCADRLYNIRDMKNWTRLRQRKYARETQKYIYPIAQMTDPWFATELANFSNRVMQNTRTNTKRT